MRAHGTAVVSMLIAVGVSTAGRTLGAQQPSTTPCAVSRSAVAPAGVSGARIGSVEIVTRPPRVGPRALEHALHALQTGSTRPAVVRRELLFAAGDTVDTLRVAESMRRLRALGFLDEAYVEARRCGADSGAVDLRVVTRDAWSVTPVVRLRGTGAALGVDDRNAFGSGVAVHATAQDDGHRFGAAMGARAPVLPAADAAADVGVVQYGNGFTRYAGVGPRSPWPDARWIVDGRIAESRQEPRSEPGTLFRRGSASLLVGHEVPDPAGASTYLMMGAESDRANLSLRGSDLAAVGPRQVHRDYAGVALGAVRASAQFDTVSWLLPGGVTDVPRGTEGELLLGAGRDRANGQGAGHVDLWAGRTLTRPGSGTLLVGDVWASGYFGDELLAASTVRSSLVLLRDAPRGLWTARVAAERLMSPDPDVRALALLDPAAAALPRPARLAEAAVATSLERDAHLFPVTRSLGIDGALFAGATYRWDPTAGTREEDLGAAVLGAGLRLAPWRTARSTLRLDVGVPVLRTPGVRGRPYVALSIVPWPLLDRGRDGHRLP